LSGIYQKLSSFCTLGTVDLIYVAHTAPGWPRLPGAASPRGQPRLPGECPCVGARCARESASDQRGRRGAGVGCVCVCGCGGGLRWLQWLRLLQRLRAVLCICSPPQFEVPPQWGQSARCW
jgi:hypothetical protein